MALQLKGPDLVRDGMDHTFMDGGVVDLSSTDWDAETDADCLRLNKLPRGLWANADGLIHVIPAAAPPNATGFTIAVLKGPVPFAVRRVTRASSDAAFQNNTALRKCF